jgi:hypothetical protein
MAPNPQDRPEQKDPPPENAHARLLDDVRKSTDKATFDDLKKMTDEQLTELVQTKKGKPENFQLVKGAYEEYLARLDRGFTEKDHAETLPQMAVILEALKRGKSVEVKASGEYTISDKPLNEDTRYFYHQAIMRGIERMDNPISVRQSFVQYLRSHNKFADAIAVAEQASDRAELLMKPVKLSDRNVRMIDLIEEEKVRLLDDQMVIGDPTKRQQMQIAFLLLSAQDDSVLSTPINVNKLLTFLHLGTDVTIEDKGQGQLELTDIQFGMNSGFKPDLAMKYAIRARDNLNYLSKNDATTASFGEANPSLVSLYGTTANMFLDGDRNGKPDLLEINSVEELTRKIKKSSTVASSLLDIGVVGLAYGAAALTRSTRAQELVGKSMSKLGMAEQLAARPLLVSQLTHLGSFATAAGTSISARHYGFKLITGVDEPWTESIVHAGGSVLTAEVGSRLSGRATSLGKRSDILSKPIQLAKMDAKASAKFFLEEGLQTTGRLKELLTTNGLKEEARAFEKLANDTSITSDAAIHAIDKAQLTFGRLGSMAGMILKEQSILARALAATEKGGGTTAQGEAGAGAKAGSVVEDFTVKTPAEIQKQGPSAISRLKNQFTDRLRIAPIDPLKATATNLSRANTAAAFYGSLGSALTYNSIVGAYDLTQNHINPATNQKYNFWEAVVEANLPTIQGTEHLPVGTRLLISSAVGTPLQALFGVPFLKPGAVKQPVWNTTAAIWSDTTHSVPYKVYRTITAAPGQIWSSISPLSNTRWNNWQAGVFNNTTLGPTGIIGSNRIWPIVDKLYEEPAPERGEPLKPTKQYLEMLKRTTQPVQNDR